eukprot:403353199
MDYLIQDPNDEDYELELVESKLLEIDDLSNGDVFAEDSIILKQPIKHSIITAIPSEIFMLDMHDFLKLHKSIIDSFLQFSKQYPEDKDLRRAFIEMNKWTRFKQDIVKTVHAETVNKKQNFEKQLRKPQQMPVKFQQKDAVRSSSVGVTQVEAQYTEKDVLNINYLSSVDYIFKAAKQKRKMMEQQQLQQQQLMREQQQNQHYLFKSNF